MEVIDYVEDLATNAVADDDVSREADPRRLLEHTGSDTPLGHVFFLVALPASWEAACSDELPACQSGPEFASIECIYQLISHKQKYDYDTHALAWPARRQLRCWARVRVVHDPEGRER